MDLLPILSSGKGSRTEAELMAYKDKDIYRGRQKSHKTAKLVSWGLLILIALAIGLFFGLKQFAVYDEYGNATIVLPFSETSKE